MPLDPRAKVPKGKGERWRPKAGKFILSQCYEEGILGNLFWALPSICVHLGYALIDMCLPAKCGAARSVSRDIPLVSFPCAEEKYTTLPPLAVPALQQQHAMVIIGGNLEITIL